MKTTYLVAATVSISMLLILQSYLMLHLNAKIDLLDMHYGINGNLNVNPYKIPVISPPQSGCETETRKNQALFYY